jgi:2-oxoglutarate ferredoxin oxidoreductase subunit beta
MRCAATCRSSELGKVTKSTPFGSEDQPFNPLALALGAGASFVARTVDRDRRHVIEVLRAAAEHPGAAFVEIYHNCPIFNDEAYAVLTDKGTKDAHQIRLEHDQPIRFGAEREHGVALRPDGTLAIVDVADVGENALLAHDAHCADPSRAFALAHLSQNVDEPTPIGVFRSVERPMHGERSQQELQAAHEAIGPDELEALLHAGATWTVD